MHAYLIVGKPGSEQPEVEKLARVLKAKILEFPIVKIEDVRNLNNLIRLSFDTPTLIYSRNIHEAGEEALNAFLKNLEEPQENIYFALTTPSVRAVLPTIVSRCQVVKTISNQQSTINNQQEIEQFLEMSEGERLSYIDKIKDRTKAIEFAMNMVFFVHGSLHKNEVEYKSRAQDLEVATKTLSGLKANGNVNLHLSNLAINIK